MIDTCIYLLYGVAAFQSSYAGCDVLRKAHLPTIQDLDPKDLKKVFIYNLSQPCLVCACIFQQRDSRTINQSTNVS